MQEGKVHQYEFDTRVPTLIKGPGIAPGVPFEQPAGNVDFGPTFLDIAGIPLPPQMDGKSVLPLLLQPTAAARSAHAEASNWRKAFLFECRLARSRFACNACCR